MDDLIHQAARDIVRASYAIALTGAGISTESGIPDFRGPAGVWTKDPAAERRAYRSYERFLADPQAWWVERLTSPAPLGDIDSAVPNAGHRALADLQTAHVLKCIITQNVDGLHEKAGSGRVLEYHGSLLKLRCAGCGRRCSQQEVDLPALLAAGGLPPCCPRCGAPIKTDTVAFGEPIPVDVVEESLVEAGKCDLMVICGTSAVVFPFANLPRIARRRGPHVTIIEINAEPTPLTREGISDYLIQGKTGDVLPKIAAEVRALQAGFGTGP